MAGDGAAVRVSSPADGSIEHSNHLHLTDGRKVTPYLAGGPITKYAPVFSASGTRLFAPCGACVFCYSVKTTLTIGTLPEHRGQVTAVCAGQVRPGEGEPIVTGTSAGEVRIWDAKTLAQLASLDVDGWVSALRWPQRNTLLVFIGKEGQPGRVERIEIQSLAAPGLAREKVLCFTERLGAVDACDDTVAMSDGKELVVWANSWQRSLTFSHQRLITAVSIDPNRRYIVVGDEQGVVWTWWGIFDEGATDANIVPGRFHWHANQVLCLAHCGPLVLSGGEEGVLCIRRADDDAPQFVPRMPGKVKHVVTSAQGKSCLCLGDNSLAFLDSLHGFSKPRWVRAVDLPAEASRAKGKKGRRRALQTILHPLPASGTVIACSGPRAHFFNERLGFLPPRSIALGSKSNTLDKTEDGVRWVLRLASFSSDAKHLLTWETRPSPAAEQFDQTSCENNVLKWWRRHGGSDEYILDTISHAAHNAEITATLALPQRRGLFVTASLDGTFKCWESLTMNSEASTCWQCIAVAGWHSKPIQCIGTSVDGSVLAVGLAGAVALFAPETGKELGVLPLAGDAIGGSGEAIQLNCTVASERFVLLAVVETTDRGQEIICWDLAQLTVIARVSLASGVRGCGRPVVRVCEPQYAGADLRLLVFRAHSEGPKYKPKESGQILLWRWSWKVDGGIEGFSQQVEVDASMPAELQFLDASFLGGGATQRIVCWTSARQLWDVDFAKDAKRSNHQEELADAQATDAPRGSLSRVLGDRSTTTTQRPQLLQLPVRTTPAQQAGLTAHLLEHIIPSSAPSHHLPPPALIWAGLLSTWGKPLQESGYGAVAESPLAQLDDMNAKIGSSTQASVEDLDLPAWARQGPLPQETYRAEVADQEFMNQLVQDSLHKQALASLWTM